MLLRRRVAWGLACLVAVPAVNIAPAAEPVLATSIQDEFTAGLEQVFVFRTTRTARTRGATPNCQSAGFESNSEDVYQLWSVRSDAETARVTDAHVKPIGEFHACFGAATGQSFPMYATGKMGAIGWTGRGECALVTPQPPEAALRALNCNLKVDELPSGYAGGWLSSSSLAPVLGAAAPPDAHLRGYMSTSVVTLRLWRAPDAPLRQ